MKKLPVILLLSFSIAAAAQTKLTPHPISLNDGRKFALNLPADYEITPAAEGFKRVRFFAKAPDGRIFVTDMYNLTDNKRGAIYILDGWDAERGKFGKVIPYMTGLQNPNSVQFYHDESGQGGFTLRRPTSSRGEGLRAAKRNQPTLMRKPSRHFPTMGSATNTAAGI